MSGMVCEIVSENREFDIVRVCVRVYGCDSTKGTGDAGT